MPFTTDAAIRLAENHRIPPSGSVLRIIFCAKVKGEVPAGADSRRVRINKGPAVDLLSSEEYDIVYKSCCIPRAGVGAE